MISGLFTIIVYAIALGLIVWLVHYIVDTIPVAPPFGRIAKIAATVVAVLVLILLLLSLLDTGPVRLPRL